jgi:hypothetical protein
MVGKAPSVRWKKTPALRKKKHLLHYEKGAVPHNPKRQRKKQKGYRKN